jgi:hypothetical protein
MAVVHHGTIYDAWADFAGMLEATFPITANSGLYEAAKAVASSLAVMTVLVQSLEKKLNRCQFPTSPGYAPIVICGPNVSVLKPTGGGRWRDGGEDGHVMIL